MNPGSLRKSTAFLLLVAGSGAATATAGLLDMSSEAIFTSALLQPPPWSSVAQAGTLAAWDAMGRYARTATPPGQPEGSPFEVDRAEAWSDFDQTASAGTYRSFAQLGGYYLDKGPYNYARNEVSLQNRVRVEYTQPFGPKIVLNIVHSSHGELLAGGIANNVVAHAQEELSWGMKGINAPPTDPPFWSGNFAGSAAVSARDEAPTIATNGDWRTPWHYTSRVIAGMDKPLQGIELGALLVSEDFILEPGTAFILDVFFHGRYEAQADAGPGGGYLSMGLADFSGTGLIDFVATDPLTGERSDLVKFTLLGAPPAVPETGTWLQMLAGLMLLAASGWRRHA